MTNSGKYVSFPIGEVKYTPPEVFLCGVNKGLQLYSSDVWSLGLILLELIMQKELWPNLKFQDIISKVVGLKNCDKSVPEQILEEHECLHLLEVTHYTFIR
jgi:TBC domain-containing protein kinase-like protein